MQLVLNGNTLEELVKEAQNFLVSCGKVSINNSEHLEDEVPPKKKGKKPEKSFSLDNDGADEAEGLEYDDDDAVSSLDEEEDEEISEKDIIKAFQAYSRKESKDEARKILKKFNAKNPTEIDKEDYAKIMKLLS